MTTTSVHALSYPQVCINYTQVLAMYRTSVTTYLVRIGNVTSHHDFVLIPFISLIERKGIMIQYYAHEV